MKKIKYSCELNPSSYKFINDRPFEIPDNGVIKWHLVNITPDMDKFKVIFAFEKVFQIWQQAFDNVQPVGRIIKLEPTEYFDQANIRLFFSNKDHSNQSYITNNTFGESVYVLNCPFNFDGEQGTLAHAWAINSQPFAAQGHFDEDEHWSHMHKIDSNGINLKMFVHLLTVALHEVGHIWILDHSNTPEAIMYASYNGEKTSLHEDDQKGLNKKWSPKKYEIAKNLGIKVKKPKQLSFFKRLFCKDCECD